MSEEIIETLRDEYLALAHAMQSGVAMEMNFHTEPTTPKHLRVGVNSVFSSHKGLVDLLLAKGIFTELEYYRVMRDSMKAEVEMYESILSEKYGREVKLA